MAEVRCILDAKTTLGECPVWSAEEQALYWVDIMAPALNRLDPDGSCRRMIDGLIVSNGMTWSANGRTMFHSDSKGQRIRAYDYDPQTGDIANRRVIEKIGARR